jgi:DNA-binding CsgD family transcriptional regulator
VARAHEVLNAPFSIVEQPIVSINRRATSTFGPHWPRRRPAPGRKRTWQSVDDTLKAQALVLTLTQVELLALESIAAGESLRDLALRLETDVLSAQKIRKTMKMKLGAKLDADALRVALNAGMDD